VALVAVRYIIFLIGFRNRLVVMIQWAWSYVTFDRGARLITDILKEPLVEIDADTTMPAATWPTNYPTSWEVSPRARGEENSTIRLTDRSTLVLSCRVGKMRLGVPGTPNCLVAIRSIFSTCNALCQGGLLTLLDVPPLVCYPSGRRWQRRGPKPGEQRNLDLRIGRESASRHDDCQHHGGRGPAVRGKVNPGEVLIKVVIRNKPKMLSGLNQKVRGQAPGLFGPLSLMLHHRPIGTT